MAPAWVGLLLLTLLVVTQVGGKRRLLLVRHMRKPRYIRLSAYACSVSSAIDKGTQACRAEQAGDVFINYGRPLSGIDESGDGRHWKS